jgi:hypothetical protein
VSSLRPDKAQQLPSAGRDFLGQRRPTSLPSQGGSSRLIAHSNRERIAEFRLFHVLVAEPGFEVLKHTLIVKRNNLLGHLKLFPKHRRALELLDEAANRVARMLRGLTEKCGQEAHARKRGPPGDAKNACQDQKSTRTS